MTIILYANLYKQSVDSIKSFLFLVENGS